jgi:hypothetical protein
MRNLQPAERDPRGALIVPTIRAIPARIAATVDTGSVCLWRPGDKVALGDDGIEPPTITV